MSRARIHGDRPAVPGVPNGTPLRVADPARDTPPDAYDALTDLFLSEVAAERPGQPALPPAPAGSGDAVPASPSTVRIEGLILGHLPVLASAWVLQYARQMAHQLRAPVALLRLRGGECALELVGSDLSAPQPGRAEPARSLEAAVAIAAHSAGAWLIRVDDLAEPVLPDLDELDGITLLTGADEAAVVSSYQTIKQLFRPAGEDDPCGPEVTLAIMGAGVDRAVDARRKLERAAETFLGRKVRVAACVSKIAGGRTTVLYRGPLVHGAIEVVQWLAPVIREADATVAAAALKPAPRFKLAVEGPATATQTESRSGSPAEIKPDPAAAPVSRLGHAGHLNGHPAPARSATAPVAAVAGESSALADHLPGLVPLEAMCPYAPQVELASDATGTIHLLARMGDEASGPPMVNQLMTADAWARAHWPLLRMSARQTDLSESFQSRLHLFTDAPPKIRLLGEADIRLHLLARVQAGGQSVWFCTDLN